MQRMRDLARAVIVVRQTDESANVTVLTSIDQAVLNNEIQHNIAERREISTPQKIFDVLRPLARKCFICEASSHRCKAD